jgi:hypothetical protein
MEGRFGMKNIVTGIRDVILIIFIIYVGVLFFLLGVRFGYQFIISNSIDQWVAIYSSTCFVFSFISFKVWYHI